MKRAIVLVVLALSAVRAHAYVTEWVMKSAFGAGDVRSVKTADLNGDGRPDAILTVGTTEVRVALARLDGTFAAPATTFTGGYVNDMLVGEVTGDGKIDVIASDTASNRIFVLPSNGDGTTGTPIGSDVLVNGASVAPSDMEPGDFNGDGKLDLVFTSYSAAKVVVLAGDGAGHFSTLASMDVYAPGISAGDLDGDGFTDLLLLTTGPSEYRAYFGKGDGTFEAPMTIFPYVEFVRVAIADLDGDGDREIITSEFSARKVTVRRNTGSRTFAAGEPYSLPSKRSTGGDPIGIAVFDADGDGNADVTVTLTNTGAIATLRGNGTGLLGPAELSGVPLIPGTRQAALLNSLAIVELDGDGRPDLLASRDGLFYLFANAAGDVRFTLRSVHPVISAGQAASFTAELQTAAGYFVPSWEPPLYVPPAASGDVLLRRDGEIVYGPVTPQGNSAEFEVQSLPVGTYSFASSFAGDEAYRAATSLAVPQTVVQEQTTTAIDSDPPGTIVWSEDWSLVASVTSPLPGSLEGRLLLYVDGVRSVFERTGPADLWYRPGDRLLPGTHEFYVEFDGSDTQPPSRSPVLRKNFVKAATEVEWSTPTEAIVRYGSRPQLSFAIDDVPHSGRVVSGNVRIYDGTTRLTTLTDSRQTIMPALGVGVHYLKAVYEGNEWWEPSESPLLRYIVLPDDGFVINASLVHGWIEVTGLPAPSDSVVYYAVFERIGGGPWTLVSREADPVFVRDSPTPGAVYSYRMEMRDESGLVLATSNIDFASVTTFTDDPVLPGMFVKAEHVTQMVALLTTMRSQIGLSAFTSPVAFGEPIRASHFAALRDAIIETRTALGLGAAPMSLDIGVDRPVRARDVQQLRDALR